MHITSSPSSWLHGPAQHAKEPLLLLLQLLKLRLLDLLRLLELLLSLEFGQLFGLFHFQLMIVFARSLCIRLRLLLHRCS